MTAPDDTPREPNVMPVGGDPGSGMMRVSDAQPTAGPWHRDGMMVLHGDDLVALIGSSYTTDADLNLITAAPDLLASLLELNLLQGLPHTETKAGKPCRVCEAWKRAHVAIRKSGAWQ